MRYLVPPRLQAKFLVGLWTFPELMVVAVLTIVATYINIQLLFIPVTVVFLCARPDFENSIAIKLFRCFRFYLQNNTYKTM